MVVAFRPQTTSDRAKDTNPSSINEVRRSSVFQRSISDCLGEFKARLNSSVNLPFLVRLAEILALVEFYR